MNKINVVIDASVLLITIYFIHRKR